VRKNPFLSFLTTLLVKPMRELLGNLDQRSSVVFLRLKGLSVKDVQIEFGQELGSDAIAYSTVTRYIRNNVILENEPEAEDRAEDQGFSITGNAILETFEIMSFAAVCQIAKMTFIPPITRFCRLTKSLHFVLKRLSWVPHRLSDLQKQARVIMSKGLLKLLESMRHHSWKYIVRFDEGWFYPSIFLLS
jgi:hypothetical protein